VNFLYDDIVHVLQNTTDSCINSATDRRGYVLERKLPNSVKWQGRLHKGGNGARCTMAKVGGNVVIIMMLLLVSIIIYYYMNTFITLHQCTF